MIRFSNVLKVAMAAAWLAASVWAQCPGYQGQPPTNLACQLATTFPSRTLTPAVGTAVGTSTGSQLSQLPIATAAASVSTIWDSQLATSRTVEDVGPIMAQRGDTLGKGRYFLSFSYQRFSFSSMDGIDMKHMPIVNTQAPDASGVGYTVRFDGRIDFRLDQFVSLATYGVNDSTDVSVVVPFSFVTLRSMRREGNVTNQTGTLIYTTTNGNTATPIADPGIAFGGSASGIGDVIFGVKHNVYKSKSEATSAALGLQVRTPTGDVYNYLGSGAWGVKPYAVLSHRTKYVTPEFSLAYQWNGPSPLFVDNSNNELNLPGSLSYSAGADFNLHKRVSAAVELLGQAVVNGTRLRLTSATPANPPTGSDFTTVQAYRGTYAMHNLSIGAKANPFGGLYMTGSVLVRLDTPGLRANFIPMIGIAYRFR